MLVVVLAPVLDHDLCLGEAGEDLDGEQLVTDPRPERLDVGVLPGGAGLDVSAPGAGEAAPVPQRVGGELRAVVAANELRRAAPRDNEAIKNSDSRVGVDSPAALDGEGLAGELIN